MRFLFCFFNKLQNCQSLFTTKEPISAPAMTTTTAVAMASPASTGKVKSTNSLELVNGRVVDFISNDAIEADYVPVIDVARMYSSNLADRVALAEEIGHAARNVGFLTIINHVSSRAIPSCPPQLLHSLTNCRASTWSWLGLSLTKPSASSASTKKKRCRSTRDLFQTNILAIIR